MGVSIIDDPVGNGRQGGLQRVENERKKNLWLFGDGKNDFEEYKKKMMKLQRGKELTKEELLWMEKVEKNLEYHLPKLARIDSSVKNTGQIKIILEDYANKNTSSSE